MSEEDLRREAVRRRRAGESAEQVAAALGRTTRWVRKWVVRAEEEIGGDCPRLVQSTLCMRSRRWMKRVKDPRSRTAGHRSAGSAALMPAGHRSPLAGGQPAGHRSGGHYRRIRLMGNGPSYATSPSVVTMVTCLARTRITAVT